MVIISTGTACQAAIVGEVRISADHIQVVAHDMARVDIAQAGQGIVIHQEAGPLEAGAAFEAYIQRRFGHQAIKGAPAFSSRGKDDMIMGQGEVQQEGPLARFQHHVSRSIGSKGVPAEVVDRIRCRGLNRLLQCSYLPGKKIKGERRLSLEWIEVIGLILCSGIRLEGYGVMFAM